MGKNRRAEYDAKRKAMLDKRAKVIPSNYAGRGRNNSVHGIPAKLHRNSSKARPSNYRAPVGFEVNSKGNAIVTSRVYRTPQVKGHPLSEPLLGNEELQVSDMFMPRESVPLVVKQAYRAKRKITPSWEGEAGAGDCIMDMYPGERIVPHMYSEPMVFERRVYRSPQHKDHTAWTFSIGAPAVIVDKRNNQPLVKHVIKFHECIGTLPPITYVDARARERAELDALVSAWRGKINADLVEYLTR